MNLQQIQDLLKIVAQSEVAELEVEEGGLKLVIRKNAPAVSIQPLPFLQPSFPMVGYPPAPYAPPPPQEPAPARAPAPVAVEASPSKAVEPPRSAPAPQAPSANTHILRAPIVGTFYRSSSPDADPFAKIGDRVKPGQVLCIIEAMKLMNEIECEVAGTIQEILVENAQPVEYDQPLFSIHVD